MQHPPILLQNTPYFPNPSPQADFPLVAMTTRPSRKAPSSLLSATKASSARTRSSTRLARAKSSEAMLDAVTTSVANGEGGSDPGSAKEAVDVAGIEVPVFTTPANTAVAVTTSNGVDFSYSDAVTKMPFQAPPLSPLGKTRAAAGGAITINSATKLSSHESLAADVHIGKDNMGSLPP